MKPELERPEHKEIARRADSWIEARKRQNVFAAGVVGVVISVVMIALSWLLFSLG